MWTAIIINIILSIIIIFIANQLWEYCKLNYTSQKTKNLVEIHASKYRQIAEDMERNLRQNHTDNGNSSQVHRPHSSSTPTESPAIFPTPSTNQERVNSVQLTVEDGSMEQHNSAGFLHLDEKDWIRKELSAFINTI